MKARRIVILKPRHIGVEEFSPGPVGEGQILTETLFSGISAGTEMCYYRGTGPELSGRWDPASGIYDREAPATFSYPLSYGYENVGRVVQVGAGVKSLAVGDVVFSYQGHQTHAVQNVSEVWKLPANVSPPAANMLAIVRLCFNGYLAGELHVGETALVLGLGTLGQIFCQLCRLAGARVVGMDLIESRRKLAMKLGAHEVIDPAAVNPAVEIRRLTGGRGADVAFEVTGGERGLESAIRCVAPHSKVVAMSFYQGQHALKLGPEFHYNCIRLQVSQATQVPVELRHRWSAARIAEVTTALLPQLQLASLVSHEFAFDQASEAYQLVDEQPQQTMQVVLRHPAAAR